MQDDAKARGDEAGEWLREHFKDDPAPRVEIVMEVTEPNPAVYQEVMEILFGP
jgi:hypothetical protein